MGVSGEQVSVQEKEELDNLEMPVSDELSLTKDPQAEAGGRPSAVLLGHVLSWTRSCDLFPL